MTKPNRHNWLTNAAALRIGAACVLSCCLVLGVLPLGTWEFASAEEKPACDAIGNVLISSPVCDASDSSLHSAGPLAPSDNSANESMWFVGRDSSSKVSVTLLEDGTLFVTGEGHALSFNKVDEIPWLGAGKAELVKRVVFDKEAKSLKVESLAHWFEGCANLEEVVCVPEGVKDLARAFFDCPKLVKLPDDFTLDPEAATKECFGFSQVSEGFVETVYGGSDAVVLGYDWTADGRKLVLASSPADPSAPPVEEVVPPADRNDLSKPSASENESADSTPPDSTTAGAEQGALAGNDANAITPDGSVSQSGATNAPSNPSVDAPQDSQISITVPASVPLSVSEDGSGSVFTCLSIVNNSDCAIAVTGVRLSRSEKALPGGVWSLYSSDVSRTYVENARFSFADHDTVLSTPVVLAAAKGSSASLLWRGSFTSEELSALVSAAVNAGDAGLAYGTMSWVFAPVKSDPAGAS